jgi:hypothetical protein
LIVHLGALDIATAKDNVLLLGPPGTGKTHPATGLAIRACQAGHRVCSRPPRSGSPAWPMCTMLAVCRTSCDGWAATRCCSATRSATSRSSPQRRTLLFHLVSSRYEQASLIVTSNKPFGRWGVVFGDEVVA